MGLVAGGFDLAAGRGAERLRVQANVFLLGIGQTACLHRRDHLRAIAQERLAHRRLGDDRAFLVGRQHCQVGDYIYVADGNAGLTILSIVVKR